MFTNSTQEKLDTLLTNCMGDFSARFILLIDRTGQVIASKGEYAVDQSAAFGSLLGGDMAASHAIAHLIGDECQLLCRECKNGRSYLVPITKEDALFIYTTRTVTLPQANKWVKRAVPALQEAVIAYEQANPSTAPFADEDDLGEVFDNALDTVWTE